MWACLFCLFHDSSDRQPILQYPIEREQTVHVESRFHGVVCVTRALQRFDECDFEDHKASTAMIDIGTNDPFGCVSRFSVGGIPHHPRPTAPLSLPSQLLSDNDTAHRRCRALPRVPAAAHRQRRGPQRQLPSGAAPSSQSPRRGLNAETDAVAVTGSAPSGCAHTCRSVRRGDRSSAAVCGEMLTA